jgi:hypothetical protein
VLANHPGAYDALSLFAAIPRDDLLVVAAERPFLASLPALRKRLLFIPDPGAGSEGARSLGLKRALRHLKDGGALLHFGAGRIEPDPAFSEPAACILDWQSGCGVLAHVAQRCGGAVVVAVVSGVHSARAKESVVVRAAEARGITTLALLMQLALPYYGKVRVRVTSARLGETVTNDAAGATRALEALARKVAASL